MTNCKLLAKCHGDAQNGAKHVLEMARKEALGSRKDGDRPGARGTWACGESTRHGLEGDLRTANSAKDAGAKAGIEPIHVHASHLERVAAYI